MKRLYLYTMKCFLPVLFILYMAGITLFTHSHVVNGVTIVHSHPFKKTANHSHTTVEFLLIHHLSHLAVTGDGLFPLSLSLVYLFLGILLSCPQRVGYGGFALGVHSLRAPPVLV